MTVRSGYVLKLFDVKRDLHLKMQYLKLHFGPGLFDPYGSKVKLFTCIMDYDYHDLRNVREGLTIDPKGQMKDSAKCNFEICIFL